MKTKKDPRFILGLGYLKKYNDQNLIQQSRFISKKIEQT